MIWCCLFDLDEQGNPTNIVKLKPYQASNITKPVLIKLQKDDNDNAGKFRLTCRQTYTELHQIYYANSEAKVASTLHSTPQFEYYIAKYPQQALQMLGNHFPFLTVHIGAYCADSALAAEQSFAMKPGGTKFPTTLERVKMGFSYAIDTSLRNNGQLDCEHSNKVKVYIKDWYSACKRLFPTVKCWEATFFPCFADSISLNDLAKSCTRCLGAENSPTATLN